MTAIKMATIPGVCDDLFGGIYSEAEIEELKESALRMDGWSKSNCLSKSVGGMEEWAKDQGVATFPEELSCDWYHGTWQYMRLLNMVAVPRWYPFYNDTLTTLLKKKPDAAIMISACADYGMLHTVDVAVKEVGANPTIVIYDICRAPLRSCQSYAERHDLDIQCHCENIIAASIQNASFDIVVTDEFLTVLQDPYKPLILEKWERVLKPGGTIVTTAMVGRPTTPELRANYYRRARERFEIHGRILFPMHFDSEEKKQALLSRMAAFASYHTRHMIRNGGQIKELFKNFDDVSIRCVSTPGECVNPTESYQIVATRAADGK